MSFRGLQLPEEPSFPNCAVGSLMFCSLLMSTSSRTNKYWPRWVGMYKKTQAEGNAQTHPGRHSITHPSLHMHTTRFHCLFVALCCCLSAPAPQIPKVPSKYLTVANLTAPPLCCVSVLSPRCWHCLYTESPTALYGCHAALHSCSHIGFLTVLKGGCCTSDKFFPMW